MTKQNIQTQPKKQDKVQGNREMLKKHSLDNHFEVVNANLYFVTLPPTPTSKRIYMLSKKEKQKQS